MPRCPLLIDTSGFWLRPEGAYFIGGIVPVDAGDGRPLEPELDTFEQHFWPLLAHRIPAFEALRVVRAWAGYYEMNTFDHNAIVGAHPTVRNFYCMNGFSGHGMQQAPAVGRALAAGPKILILDEPTEGIQPSIIKDIGNVISALTKSGEIAVLLVEQYYDFAKSLADHYLVMSRGEIIKQGLGKNMDSENVRACLAL